MVATLRDSKQTEVSFSLILSVVVYSNVVFVDHPWSNAIQPYPKEANR